MDKEDIKLWERVKIFILSLTWIPLWNFLRAKIKLSDLFLAFWFISLVGFILERFSKLPIGIKFIGNIYLLISLFVIYIILILIDRWKNKIDIANYRKFKGYPNPQEIHRMKLNAQNLSDEKLIDTTQKNEKSI